MPARDLPREKLTPTDDLREMLQQCELKVVALKGTGVEAANLLHLMDKAQSLFHQLAAKGIDLRAERSRWETIEHQLRSRATVLLKEIQAIGGLAQLREAIQPPPDHWWWFLDEEIRRQKRRSLKRMGIGGIVALLILPIAILLYQRFLIPDPLTRQAFHLAQRAERAIQEGHLEEALTEYEALRKLKPNDPETFLRLGVLYKVLGRDNDAAQSYAQARDLLNSQADFFLERGMIYLELGWWTSAQADAQAALALTPESALGHFILGSVYEAQGRISESMNTLRQAAELAYDQGESNLYALIKIHLGVLMESGGGIGP
jgi:tetratricopeptide (TPR) repeat protein